MSSASGREPIPNLKSPEYYFNRELSWLEFNYRVLHEALDSRTPLLERLKFMAIFSANLDEFFMVRVAVLKRQVEANVTKLTPDGRTPQEQLAAISQRLQPMVREQHQHFEGVLRPLMSQHGIYILSYAELSQEQRSHLQRYFKEQIFPVLTPLAVDSSHPFPYMSNLSFNLAVMVKDDVSGQRNFARVKVPVGIFPRFLQLPKDLWMFTPATNPIWVGVCLEQVIAHNLQLLFQGKSIEEYYAFRITRDTDLIVNEDEADDLLLAIEQELLSKRRLGGSVVRLEIQASMPPSVRQELIEGLRRRQSLFTEYPHQEPAPELQPEEIYQVEGLLGLGNLMSFLEIPLAEQKDPPWTPVVPHRLQRLGDPDLDLETSRLEPENTKDFFSEIRNRGDLLVHHPYHSFAATVQRFLTQAAHDPHVLAIKMTLYRTSGDSPIINALIRAAEQGKQVAVLVELKARFDEANNIGWAHKLEQSGVHVIYGLVGLKTHTKTALVVRREGGRIRRYVHIGTGNYNPKTAGLYTDLGLFSCREDLGADLTDLFNFLTGSSQQKQYRQLLVAPVNMRDRMVQLVQREAEHACQGHQGRIVAKMNALVDPQLIAALYEAAQAGVRIELIVRGICCLRPSLPGISDTIQVISIVGRFLEHSRVFYFQNQGEEEVYIGSADWMPRNLDRRVEAITPIADPKLVKELQEILGILLTDNRQAWELQSDGTYIRRRPKDGNPEESAHQTLMAMTFQAAQEGR